MVYAASFRLRRYRGAAQSGEHDPKPKSPYALQKLVGEYYLSVFPRCYGLETVALRYFNVYGPRQDPSSPYSGVLSLFMRCDAGPAPPTIFGDGEQSRDFTFVEDVAELNLKAASAKGVSGKVYNGGNGGRITLNQAWALLQKIEGVADRAVRAAAPGRRARFAGRHHARRARSGPCAALLFRRRHALTLEWYRKNHRSAVNPEFRRGVELFNAGAFYECHEVLEDVWRPSRGIERLFLQSLIHFAVGFYHHQEGNRTGAELQLRKSAQQARRILAGVSKYRYGAALSRGASRARGDRGWRTSRNVSHFPRDKFHQGEQDRMTFKEIERGDGTVEVDMGRKDSPVLSAVTSSFMNALRCSTHERRHSSISIGRTRRQ